MIFKYEELSFHEIQSLEKDSTICMLAISPYEVHGPHLPLNTDILISEILISKIIEKMKSEYPEKNILILPTLTFGTGSLNVLGSVNLRQKTLKDLVIDYVSSFTDRGFKTVFMVSNHGAPRHIVAIEEAALFVSRKPNVKAVSLSGSFIEPYLRCKLNKEIEVKLNRELSKDEKEALSFDHHAGFFETGVILKYKKDLVSPVYKELEPIKLSWFKEKFGVSSLPNYVGSPKLANEELSEAILEVFKDRCLSMIEYALQHKRVSFKSLSRFYFVPTYRSHFSFVLIMLMSMVAGITALLFVMKSYIGNN